MMQSLTPNLNAKDNEDLSDIQRNGLQIEALVKSEDYSYLEATIYWLESNSLSETSYNKYVPNVIIDKIKLEVKEYNLVRPSIISDKNTVSLDFLL